MENVIKFTKLVWEKEEYGAICAKPEGLKWSYYIFPLNEGFELYLFDSFDQYHKDFSKPYPTLKKAKEKAVEHYLSTLNKFVQI